MTQVRRIIGDVPPTRTTEAKRKPESTGPSVFAHAYEGKNRDGKISAEELNIATKLEAAQKTLSKLAKSVSRSDVASTIEKLQNMAETLKNGTVSYDRANSAKIDEITADCNQRIADAEKISKIVEQLKQNQTKGVETFDRTTFSSQTALRALGDETHNINAEKLLEIDKKNKEADEIKAQLTACLQDIVTRLPKEGGDLDLSKIPPINGKYKITDIKAKSFANADDIEGEKRDEKGRQVINLDGTDITMFYEDENGKEHSMSVSTDKIPKGTKLSFIREGDKGINVKINVDKFEIR